LGAYWCFYISCHFMILAIAGSCGLGDCSVHNLQKPFLVGPARRKIVNIISCYMQRCLGMATASISHYLHLQDQYHLQRHSLSPGIHTDYINSFKPNLLHHQIHQTSLHTTNSNTIFLQPQAAIPYHTTEAKSKNNPSNS
jgi:hypothetical protein